MTSLAVEVADLHHAFPNRRRGTPEPVLDGVSFTAETGEVVGLFGPSGCGKSTLLRIVCGITTADRGQVRVLDASGADWRGPVAYVPQAHDLFPWKTLLDNALLGRRIAEHRKPDRTARAAASSLIERFGLSASANRYPHQVSGGERQRTALIRALLPPAPVLVLDEPLASVDYLTRAAISETLLGLVDERVAAGSPITSLMVSHDPEELLLLCDRIIVFSQRPARMIETVVVPFDRPRTAALRFEPEFVSLKRKLWGLLEPLQGARS